jgi:hypothetical protein
LLLAVAGGLFAQVTWAGRYYGGFRFDFAENADTTVRLYSYDLGDYLNQARLILTYKNDAGTLGGSVQLRSNIASTSPVITNIPIFYGWFTMFEGKVKINIGKFGDSEFNEQQWWAGFTYWSSGRPGVAAYFYPADGFRLGFGLATRPDTAATTLAEKELRYWAGVAYEGENFGAYLNGQYQKDNVNLALSGYFDADPVLVVAYADFMRLDDYANNGEIGLGFAVSFSGVENLGVSLTPEFVLHGDGSDADINISLGLDYSLDVAGLKLIGLDVGFDVTGEELELTPYLTFGQSSSRNYLKLGYDVTIPFDSNAKVASGLFITYLFRF